MGLQSKLFAGDPKLEAAAVSDPAHILQGARGAHVGKIQTALLVLDGAKIADGELAQTLYGKSTADAVLGYKTKRKIINSRYQASADNIVGKMTMAALDCEVAAAEQVVTNPIIVPLDPPLSPVRPNPSVRRQTEASTRAFAAVPVRASIGSFRVLGTPRIAPFGIEIDQGDTGTFQVIGGKGERLFIEDVRVGLLIDPSEPGRERALVDVTSDPQTFKVKGVGAGTTNLMVTKREGVFIVDVGTVATPLTVNPLTVEKLWRPRLEPVMVPPRKRSPFMVNNQLSVQVSAEMFRFDGTVDPRPEIRLDDFEIGFVQTLLESMMEAVYTDNAGGNRRIFEITCQRLPVRDSDGAIPWTGPETVKDLAAARTVHFEDRPSNVVPWQSDDKRVTLRSSTGADKFITFFVARHKRSRQVTVLARARWQTSWAYEFDFANGERATPVAPDGQITDVAVGPGPEQPILGGDTALQTLRIGFRR